MELSNGLLVFVGRLLKCLSVPKCLYEGVKFVGGGGPCGRRRPVIPGINRPMIMCANGRGGPGVIARKHSSVERTVSNRRLLSELYPHVGTLFK